MTPDAEKGDDALESIIVIKRPRSLTRKSCGRNKSNSPSNKRHIGSSDRCRKRSCRCQHGDRIRQRHNVTQTPDSVLSCSQLHSCHRHNSALDCCGSHKSGKNHCGLINDDLKTNEITCHCHITHHCHRYSSVSIGSGVVSGDGKENVQKLSEQRRQHHNHQHRHEHLHNNQHDRRHPHLPSEFQTANAKYNIRHLPGYNSKSSYDSSDDLHQSDLDAAQQERLQAIAVEIDAATMTEGNTSTATSNFAYKIPMGNMTAAIIKAPLHDQCEGGSRHRQKHTRRRCLDSMSSISTDETDELSRNICDELDDKETVNTNKLIEGSNNAHHGLWGSRDINDLYDRTEMTKSDNRRTEDETKTPQHLICCDGSMCCITNTGVMKNKCTSAAAHNECVKIQRKLFKASATDDCCSTCSHCTNCSCLNADATSCSSFDDLDADEEFDDRQMTTSHELVVAAECHRCNIHRRSTSPTSEEAADAKEEENGDSIDKNEKFTMKTQRPKKSNAITDSSTHTSRRSSASFCSCHSGTCYCCECNANADAGDDDDCDTATTGQMRTARDTSFTPLTSAAATTADFDVEHSSTLTPLTTTTSSIATTPGAEEADITLRSMNNTLTEDAGSSLSQSVEYFSLSSSNRQIHVSPTDASVRRSHKLHSENGSVCAMPDNDRICHLVDVNDDEVAKTASSRKPCKRYIKHHRHKRSTSPLDGYL